MKNYLSTGVLFVCIALFSGAVYAGTTNHALDVFWGTRVNHFVWFNDIRYASPDLFGVPLGIDAGLKTDETFYFFTFSSYTLSADVRYRAAFGDNGFARFSAGFFVMIMPFYSKDANWVAAAPTAEIAVGWTAGVLSLEWENRFRFYIDGFDWITGIAFAWEFLPRLRLSVTADYVAAVLYDFSRTESAVECMTGFGFLF